LFRRVEEDEELAGPSCDKAKEAMSHVVGREEGEKVRAEPTTTTPTTTATQRPSDDAALSGLHINDLPQELQQHILSFLGPADLLLRYFDSLPPLACLVLVLTHNLRKRMNE
jgi:hypothetical protein